MMEVNWSVVATIVAPLITLFLGAFLSRIMERRPRLVTYIGHVGAHKIKGPNEDPFDIFTHSVVIFNAGGKPAKNVRVIHRSLPNHNVFPNTQYEKNELQEGAKEFVFPALVPKEQITISYLYYPPLTYDQVVESVRSDEGFAKFVKVLPIPQYPMWFNRTVLALMFFGVIAILYLIIVAVIAIFH